MGYRTKGFAPTPLPPHPLKDNIAKVQLELLGSHPTSTHYRLLIGDSGKPMDVPIPAGEVWRKRAFEQIRATTIKGIETRIPQGVPPGTTEAAYPGMESRGNDLLSRDFFIKTLDRAHYPDGVGMDNRGNPIDDHGRRIDKRGNQLDAQGNSLKPGLQVSDATAATLASTQAH
jgi:hypothetical protein